MNINIDTDVTSMAIGDLIAHKAELEDAITAVEKKLEDNPDETTEGELKESLEELQARLNDVKDRIDNQLWCVIGGDIIEIDEVSNHGYLPEGSSGKLRYIFAEDSESAGEAARKYWEDMAGDDPEEFTYIVGEKTLVQWGLGRYAGPGSTQVKSLEEWLDLWLSTPEEQWAGYDGAERDVEFVSEALCDELGFRPGVAYRDN